MRGFLLLVLTWQGSVDELIETDEIGRHLKRLFLGDDLAELLCVNDSELLDALF